MSLLGSRVGVKTVPKSFLSSLLVLRYSELKTQVVQLLFLAQRFLSQKSKSV